MPVEQDLKAEFDTLKTDVDKLKDDIGDLLDLLRQFGTERAGQTKASVEEELLRRREELREALVGARARGEKVAKAVSGEVEQHPFNSMLMAFGLGVVIAKLLDSGKHN